MLRIEDLPRARGRSAKRDHSVTINHGPKRKAVTAKVLPFIANDRADLRSLVETALADDSHDFLQDYIDALMSEVAIVDPSGHILATSKKWQLRESEGARETGRRPAKSVAQSDFRANDAHLAQRVEKCVARVLTADLATAELRFTRGKGKGCRHYKVRVTPLRMGATVGALIVNEDQTEVRNLHLDNQRLARQLIRTEEHERRRIGLEMHDSTLQDLVAIGLNLTSLRKSAADPVSGEVLREVQVILARVQQDIRTMSFLLHPPLIDEAGLVPALTALIRGVSKRMEIRIDFFNDAPEVRLPAEVELALYRVAQEALINIHKHASASYAAVRCYREGDQFVLQVEDDGVGMGGRYKRGVDVGVGISGMRARVREIGGSLILSKPVKGTVLKVLVPVSCTA